MKTFRAIKIFTVYSKKKGAHQKREVLVKDLKTWKEADDFILAKYPEAKFSSNENCYRVSGLLHPQLIKIY